MNVKACEPTQLAVWAVCLSAIACAAASLSWKIVHDTPVMLYQANLMVAHGQMPYRDFFCINMPGALWAYAGLIRLFGLSDMALHVANAMLVGIIVALTCLAFPREQRMSGGLFAAGIGALRIYSGESYFILQRELLALVPLSAIACVGLRRPLKGLWNDGVLGVLVGSLVLVKPQFVLFGLPAFILLWMDGRTWGERIRAAVVTGAFFALPLLLCAVWLYRNGAIPRFYETVTYWTLYGQMTQSFTFLPPAERGRVVLRLTAGMLFSPYTAAVLAALVLVWRERLLERRELVFWGSVPVIALLVLGLCGQFWGYHKLPFFFFSLVIASRLICCRKLGKWLAIVMAAAWIPFSAQRVWRETTEPSVVRLKQGVAESFRKHLQGTLKPGETVQPMDWTYAALHAMLLVDAPPATRFLEYSYFLHNVSHPLIRGFRKEFMVQLNDRPPRFILEARAQNWPKGLDTESHFVEFETWRDTHYRVAGEAQAYRIWEYHIPDTSSK
ncbi:MAG TPA: hypothetical protein P5026_02565 [Kiritimatiellia bacterium]|nr:hypothetical protein [Kiritimatiellia bacterium]